jgi:hypothetical protein
LNSEFNSIEKNNKRLATDRSSKVQSDLNEAFIEIDVNEVQSNPNLNSELNESFFDENLINIDCTGDLYRLAFNSDVSNVKEHFVGSFDKICRHCHSINFEDESFNGEFSLCCN